MNKRNKKIFKKRENPKSNKFPQTPQMDSHSPREKHKKKKKKWKKEGANEGVGKQMEKKKYKGDGRLQR